jgi:hypothetical protein
MTWGLLEMVIQNLPALNKYTRVLIVHRYDSDPLNQLALFVFGAMWIVYTVFLVQTHQYVYVRNQVAVQRLQHHDQEKIVRDDNYYLMCGLENRLHMSDVLSMKNYIYFSIVAAAILALVFFWAISGFRNRQNRPCA